MRATELAVLLDGDRLATLARSATGRLELEYDDRWRTSAYAVPMSTSLPFATRRHHGPVLENFLDNLLPDSSTVRDHWATEAGLTSTAPFDLLSIYGRDVAGALEFVPTGSQGGRGHQLVAADDAQIARHIATLRQDRTAWLTQVDEVGRFSLAGAQAKFALALREGVWYQPFGDAPATHIFKPSVTGLVNGDAIEFLMMRSAGQIGLPASDVALSRFDGERSLVVRRFDRRPTEDGLVERLHQEDALQALGLPRLQKYQKDHGPDYRAVLALLDDAAPSDARASKLEFVRALAFSWIVLNTDAHAKNFAVLLEPDSKRLAPLYDVSSWLPYLRSERRRDLELEIDGTTLSMGVHGSYRVGEMPAEAWRSVARDARIDPDEFLSWIAATAARLPEVLGHEVDALPAVDRSAEVDLLLRRMRIRATQVDRVLRRG